MKRSSLFYSFLLSSLILSGCASLPPQDPSQPLQHFNSIGRVALKSSQESGQASFVWKQKSPENIDLLIQGPLGKGRVDLDVSPKKTVLTMDGKTYEGTSPDELFFAITEINWPVSNMKSWLIGKPINEATQITMNTKGKPESFVENGWTVQYDEWMTYKKRPVPKRITLTNNDVRLRILVEHWQY